MSANTEDPETSETATGGPVGERRPVEAERAAVSVGVVVHPDALSGQRLADRYDVLERLGAGGMGVVYRARQIGVDRDVALKVVTGAAAGDAHALARFRREARLLSRLRHPNLVTVHDFGVTEQGLAYLVMEMLRGHAMTDLLAGGAALPLERALTLFDQACAGLEAAHAQGIVHRDLKPDNLFLEQLPDGSDHLRVLDFGLARADEAQSLATATGAVMGTPAYMAPEQARGEPTDARTDLYQLGVVLFQMVSGQRPFNAPTPMAVMVQHMTLVPPALDAVLPSAPPSLVALTAELLRKAPGERPQSLREVRQRVAAVRAGLLATPEPSLVLEPRRARRGLGLVAVAALAGVVAAAFVGFTVRNRTPPPTEAASAATPLPVTEAAKPAAEAPSLASTQVLPASTAPAVAAAAASAAPAAGMPPRRRPGAPESAPGSGRPEDPPAARSDVDRALESELSGMTR
jgi:hypothetical protein